jgi:DNA-binding IclR family transcriptional regulator
VTPGFASVAAPVLDHNSHPVAGLAVTFAEAEAPATSRLAEAVRRAAAALTTRLGGAIEAGGTDRRS